MKNSTIILQVDELIEDTVIAGISRFLQWVEKNVSIPKTVIVHLINETELVTERGGTATGSFFAPYERTQTSVIKVAVGDFIKESREQGTCLILDGYLHTLAHELIHYEQWIMMRPFREREAINQGADLVAKFVEDEVKYITHAFADLGATLPQAKQYYTISIIGVCIEFIELIAQSKSEKAIDWLIELSKDSCDWIRCAAVQAMQKVKGKAVIQALIDQLAHDPEAIVQAYAVESLQYVGDQSCVPFLLTALNHPDPDVRGCAAVALGWRQEQRYKDDIEQKLRRERSPRARLRFCVALFLLGEETYKEKIYVFLTNRSPIVRDSAVGYIDLIPLDEQESKRYLVAAWIVEKVDWVKERIAEVIDVGI